MQIDTAYSTGIQYSQQKAAETTASKALHAAEDKKLKEACKGFEAMFMNMMYKEMRKSVPKNELFGNSNADERICWTLKWWTAWLTLAVLAWLISCISS